MYIYTYYIIKVIKIFLEILNSPCNDIDVSKIRIRIVCTCSCNRGVDNYSATVSNYRIGDVFEVKAVCRTITWNS